MQAKAPPRVGYQFGPGCSCGAVHGSEEVDEVFKGSLFCNLAWHGPRAQTYSSAPSRSKGRLRKPQLPFYMARSQASVSLGAVDSKPVRFADLHPRPGLAS